MVDNFELIRNFYESDERSGDPDNFLFGQIISRKKDGYYKKNNSRVIKDVVIESPEDFDKKKGEITSLCEKYKARCYINVNPRSYKKVALEVAMSTLEYISSGSESSVKYVFSKTCGKIKPKGSYWIVDVDDMSIAEDIKTKIPNIVLTVPTVKGIHYICSGFDVRDIKSQYEDLDIHKNNPTLLYSAV